MAGAQGNHKGNAHSHIGGGARHRVRVADHHIRRPRQMAVNCRPEPTQRHARKGDAGDQIGIDRRMGIGRRQPGLKRLVLGPVSYGPKAPAVVVRIGQRRKHQTVGPAKNMFRLGRVGRNLRNAIAIDKNVCGILRRLPPRARQ